MENLVTWYINCRLQFAISVILNLSNVLTIMWKDPKHLLFPKKDTYAPLFPSYIVLFCEKRIYMK